MAVVEVSSELLLKINQGIPADLQHRYNELIGKRQNKSLTPKEYEELLQLNVWCEFSQSMILIGLNACRGSVSEPADRRGNYAPTESRQINSHQAFN